jgi:hypothetical protein
MLENKLAVITTYYNPCNYKAPLRNYYRFAEGMNRVGAHLYTVELAFRDEPFVLDNDNVIRFRSNEVMWYKENLTNIALLSIPKEYNFLSWIDADIIFHDSDLVSWCGSMKTTRPTWFIRVRHTG